MLKEYNCNCKKCISYCKNVPGRFLPEDIKPFLDYMNLSLEEAYNKYLIIDYLYDNEKIYLLVPFKNIKESSLWNFVNDIEKSFTKEDSEDFLSKEKLYKPTSPGGIASYGYAFCKANCIFLKENKCSIYKVRPWECKVSHHTLKKEEIDNKIVENIKKNWKEFHEAKEKYANNEFYRMLRKFIKHKTLQSI